MAEKMFLVSNATNLALRFENTANAGDTLDVPPFTAVHTKGVHGNLCLIPGCVDPKDFAERHMSVRSTDGNDFQLYFWSGEKDGKPLFTNTKPEFVPPSETKVAGSDTWVGTVLMIYRKDEKIRFGFDKLDLTDQLS